MAMDPVQEKRRQAEARAADAETTFRSVVIEWLGVKDKIPDSYREKIIATFAANVIKWRNQVLVERLKTTP